MEYIADYADIHEGNFNYHKVQFIHNTPLVDYKTVKPTYTTYRDRSELNLNQFINTFSHLF